MSFHECVRIDLLIILNCPIVCIYYIVENSIFSIVTVVCVLMTLKCEDDDFYLCVVYICHGFWR